MSTVIERQKDMSDLSKRQRLFNIAGRPMFWLVTAMMNHTSDETELRYDLDNNRISISGTSENPGDVPGHNRGVGMMAAVGVMISMACAMMLTVAGVSMGGPTGILESVTYLLLMGSALGYVLLAMSVGTTAVCCEVVDHTTEPLPDDLDDLKQQYVDGDLDDTEFEAQLEDRLAEVDG